MQCACATLSSVACPASQYFYGTIFEQELWIVKCVFWFSVQLFFKKIFLILRRTEHDVVINVHRSAVKYAFFLSDFNETWILSIDFRKIFKYQISWKSVQWEPSCSMRTDMAKPTVAFRNFTNAPENCGWSVRIRLANVQSYSRSFVLDDSEQNQNRDIFFARD
jgi:hypothetical protein